MDNRIVEGYIFEDEATAAKAKKEYFNICKIKNNIDLNNIDNVKKTYLKLIEKDYFTTVIGVSFLHEMREYLVENLGEKGLPMIKVNTAKSVKTVKIDGKVIDDYNQQKVKQLKKDNTQLSKVKFRLTVLVFALFFAVIGMLYIIINNENVGYFNAEDKVMDKYSAWQERLESWENELNEREFELDEQTKQ